MPAIPSKQLTDSKFCNKNNVPDSRARKRDKIKWSAGYNGVNWNSKKKGSKSCAHAT